MYVREVKEVLIFDWKLKKLYDIMMIYVKYLIVVNIIIDVMIILVILFVIVYGLILIV